MRSLKPDISSLQRMALGRIRKTWKLIQATPGRSMNSVTRAAFTEKYPKILYAGLLTVPVGLVKLIERMQWLRKEDVISDSGYEFAMEEIQTRMI
jgi:hypothetical protein